MYRIKENANLDDTFSYTGEYRNTGGVCGST